MRRLERSPGPWRYELGLVFDAAGDVVADNVQVRDGPLVAAAPALAAALEGTICHACTYRIGEPREGPGCSSCAAARAAVAAVRERAARAHVGESG